MIQKKFTITLHKRLNASEVADYLMYSLNIALSIEIIGRACIVNIHEKIDVDDSTMLNLLVKLLELIQ